MGFKGAKKEVLSCMEKGYVSHEQRNDINIKNLLATGQITLERVAEIIGRSRGDTYSSSPHHSVKEVDVHIIKTRHEGQEWYIKWYFVEPSSVFISVHH